MATNGNIDYGNNGNAIPTKGVSSNIANRQAKREFSNQFWEPDIGYLAKATEELKNQNKAMLEILNTDTKLKKAQKDRLDLNLKENDRIIAKLNKMRDTQEASFKDIQDTMNEASTAVNNSLKAQNKLLDRNNEKYKEQLEYFNAVEKEINSMNMSTKELAKTISKTQGSFAKGMSETLGTISSEFRELSNMFNLNDIANGKINTYVKSKLDTQNDIMKQFGMQSVNQYISLKNNMDSTLNNMNKDFNNMFNQTDLKNYMSNLSNLGITDTTTAQQQMRSSMLATKYLGTSNETQQEIFKYMKRTNDYSMLDNHNKTITGILKAQLGVSSEQLDMMQQQALNNVDALAGLGLNADVQGQFVDSYTKSQAALTSLYGQDVSSSIMDVVSEFANSSFKDLSNLTKKYGAGAAGAYNSFINTGDVDSLIQFLMSNAGWANINGNAGATATLQSQLGQDRSFNAAILSTNYSDFVGKLDDIEKAVKDGGSVDDFIKNTTQVTAVDKISNMLDSFINGLDWASYIDLSTAAFGFWGAAKVFDIISFFGDAKSFKLFSKLPDFFKDSKLLGGLGKVGSGILSVGGGIALGFGAANIISSAIEASYNKTKNAEINAATNQLQGTSLEGNTAAISNLGISNAIGQKNNFLTKAGASFSSATKGLGVLSFGWTRDLAKINQDDWDFMQQSMRMRNMTPEQIQLYTTAWQLLLMSAGRQTDISDFRNLTTDDMSAYIKSKGWTKDLLNRTVNSFNGTMTKPNKSIKANQENIDWNKLNLGIGGIGNLGIGGGGKDLSFKPYGITAGYPYYPEGGRHTGVDFGFHENTPIGATVGGTVQYVKDSGNAGYGRHVLIHGADGKYYLYGHMNRPMVSNGQQVVSGQLLGYSGNTGNSTGPHLHYEVRNSSSYGSDIDPYPYINSSLWSIGTSSPMPAGSVAGSTEAPIASSSMPIATRRALPSDFSNTVGVGGTEAIVDSNDNNMDKLIKFLSGIKGEQDINREILMAYSRANASSNINI